MTQPNQFNPQFDLLLERNVDVPKELVWKAWTTPDQVKRWFTPAPWKTVGFEIDLRPGGRFKTIMQSPEGLEISNEGCFLEIVENERLIWTSALKADYRPNIIEEGLFSFTAVISLMATETGTQYSAMVIHATEAARSQHESMGFKSGWGAALDQMVAMIKEM